MKFEIGDKIILLHSLEEGTVVDLINSEMVLVEVEGVSFPVYTDQIDFPYFKRFTEKKTGTAPFRPIPGEELPREKKPPAQQEENGLFLSFLPVYHSHPSEEAVHQLKLHLVNETRQQYRFHYRLYLGNALFLELKNELAPFAHFYLNDLLLEQWNDNPRFDFIFSLKEPQKGLADQVQKTVRLKAKQLFQKLEKMQLRQEASFSLLLFDHYPKQQAFAKKGMQIEHWTPPVAPRMPDSVSRAYELPKYEVDLHIEKLVPEWRGLSNFEILTIQLHEFQRFLDLAMAHRQHSMVVIHGVGKGKLREEVHIILQNTPAVRNFVNQYDVRYGYGATEIFFEY